MLVLLANAYDAMAAQESDTDITWHNHRSERIARTRLLMLSLCFYYTFMLHEAQVRSSIPREEPLLPWCLL
jgi:hypothetical protein